MGLSGKPDWRSVAHPYGALLKERCARQLPSIPFDIRYTSIHSGSLRANSHNRRIAKAVCSFAAPLRRCYNEQDRG
jgi:hypothetical protein